MGKKIDLKKLKILRCDLEDAIKPCLRRKPVNSEPNLLLDPPASKRLRLWHDEDKEEAFNCDGGNPVQFKLAMMAIKKRMLG